MTTLNDLFRTTTTARLGIKRLGGAALAAIAGGVLLSGGALAQTITQPVVYDASPSLLAPGALEPGDTLQVEFSIASPILTNVVDTGGGVLTADGAFYFGLSTSVSLTSLGTGGTVTTFSGATGASSGITFLADPNCGGTGPSSGASVASWSGMSPGDEYFNAAGPSCTIAATFTLPSDIPPGAYTLSFDDLTGVQRDVAVTGSGFGTFIISVTSSSVGPATAFSTPLNDASFTVVADTTAPSGLITVPAGPLSPGEVFAASIVFDEPIIGFDASDVVVANGTLSDFVANTNEAGDTTSFNFNVTAGASGPVTIDVGAAAGQDAAGNDNAALTQASLEIAGELTIAASFLGDPPEPGDTTSLRFTIQNSDDTETGDITFFTSDIDENLTGLQIFGAATANTCGSTPSGTNFLIVTGGSVAASSSCIIEFDVLVPVSATPGTYRVGSSDLSYSYPVAGAAVSDAAATQLTVAGAEGAGAPLAFSKAFTNDPVLPGATVTLEYTIVPEENTSASALAFTDDLDAVLTGLVATGLPQTDVCGTGSTLSGTDTISLSGGNLADGETCSFSVTVQTPVGSSGDFVSATSELTGNQDDGGGDVAIDTGFIASDTLTLINQIPQVTITGPAGPVAVGEDFTVSIEFSEPVTGFLLSEIDLTSGASAAASNLQTSDNEAFTVTITPSAAGSVVVGVPAGVAQDGDANDNVAATNYTVSVQAAAPEIAVQFVGAAVAISDGDTVVSTVTLTDFGTVDAAAGQLQRTVTVSNSGVGALSIASITLSDNVNYTLASIPTSVAGGGSETFTITYDPTTAATHAATVTITSDDADEAVFDFVIQGVGGSAPEINVVGNAVNIADGENTTDASDHTLFDSIDAGNSGTRTFTIENLGSNTLTLGSDSVSITNDTDGVFSVTAQPATQIAAGFDDTFTVQAAPATPGTFTAQISIASDDADENPYTFAIEIEATGAPEVDLQGNALSIVSGDVTASATDGTDFDAVELGSSPTATFTILNTGNSDLVLTSPSGDRSVAVERQSGSTDFTISAQPGFTVGSGASETFTVQYTPTVVGAATAVFGFATNDTDEALYTFTVAGTGAAPEINVTGNGLDIVDNDGSPDVARGMDFGSVGVSSGLGVSTFVIENTGNGVLTLGADAASISGDATFTITSQPATTVAAGGTTTFEVTFDPIDLTLDSAQVLINNDDADENPYNFIVQGNGSDDIAPTGYSVSFDDSVYDASETGAVSFTMAGAEVGATLDYSVASSGGGTAVSGSVVVASAAEQVTGLDVSGLGDGTLTVTVSLTDTASNVGGDVTDTATLDTAEPGFSKAFSPASVSLGATSTLTFTIDNSASAAILSALDFTDSLPSGMTVATTPNASTTCTGGTLTAVSGSGTVAYTSGGLSAGSTCTVSVDVIGGSVGSLVNTSGDLTSNQGNSGTATDTLTVTQPSFSIADVTVDESAGTATFTVSLSGVPAISTTVDYATSDGTAEAGADYTAATGTLTFAVGDDTETFTVAITDDTVDEAATETFTVTLSNPANATISDGTATGSITDNDDAPEISIADVTAGEGDGTATFTVSLTNASSSTVTVDFATNPGTADAGTDYITTTGTLTFAPGDTSETIGITLIDDALDEADETYTVDLSSPANATISDASATGVISDNDATPGLSIDDVTVAEGDGTATFTVTLDAASGQTVTVGFTTNDGTAVAGSDYTAASGTLTFTPGDTSETVTVSVADDLLDEVSEGYTVDLSAPVNATLSDASGAGIITDNDDAPGVSIGDVTVAEGSGTAVFTVSLDAASGQTVTVDFATADGTAVAGSDYTANTGTVTFASGDTSETVTVNLTDDALDEADETFTVGLSNPSNVTIADASATGTITDNDAAPSLSIADVTVGEGDGIATFTVSLDAASGQTVTVGYATADGTAEDGSDYTATSGVLTFTPGDTTETFTVSITDDALDETNEVFGAGLASATNATIGDDTAQATITDNDAAPSLSIADVIVDEGDGTATFTVSLDAASGQTVTVGFATADGTAVAGSDYTAISGTLTFTPGDISETLAVSITDDALDEPNEGFGVGLASATNATIADDTATGTITDNDDAPIIDVGSILVDEGDGTATLTVSLRSVSGQTVTVDAATSDSSALAGSDYVSSTQTLTFAPGEQVKTFDVSIIDDALDEADEAFEVTLSNPTNANVGSARAAVTIGDNDDAPELSIADVTVSEAAGTATFTVTASAVSAQTMTVDFATADGTATTADSDYTAATGTATINPGDTTADITVTITDDGVVEADETYTVDLSNPGNATITGATATGTITNDDAAPIGYTASFDADPINSANASSASFTFASAIVGTTYDFTISSDGGGADVTGSGSVTSASQQVSGLDVSGLGDGTLTLSVLLTDTFGNAGLPVSDTATKETTLPGVAITTASADPVSGAFTVTFTFDEDVTGFTVGDITVGNGAAGSFSTTSASVYTADITPTADGTVTVDVAAGVAQDGSGNDNTAATQFSIESDSTAPSVAISTDFADPVSGVFLVFITFSEDVTGFQLSDLSVVNGTAANFGGSGNLYSAEITPTVDGTVTVDVAAGVAADAAGNGNSAADQFSIESDGTSPTVVSVVVSDTDVRLDDLGTPFTLEITFSEPMLPAGTINFSERLAPTFTFNALQFNSDQTVLTYTLDLNDTGLAEPDIDVLISDFTDLAGNVMTPSTTEDVFSYDLRRGGITVTQTVIGLIDGEFDFSGDLGDFTITTSGLSGNQVFADLAEGAYAVTLAEEDGFSITGLACNGGSTTVDLPTRTATITLAPGDAVECAFEATADATVDDTTIPVSIALDIPAVIEDPAEVSSSFTLTNAGGEGFAFTAATDQPWVTIDPTSGTIPASGQLEFTITLNEQLLLLAPGTYTANIIITQAVAAGSTSSSSTSSADPQVITIPVTVQLAPREGTLTLVTTTAPSVAGEGVFTYSSDIAELDGLSLTTVGGTASSEGLTVLRGSYDITQAVSEGWRLDSISCTGDTDGGSTFDVANGTATIDLDPEETMVCTFANRRDEDFIREVTQSAIRSFMAARADQILTHSPDVARRLRGDRAGSTPNRFSVDMTENRLNASLSTSLSAIRQAASERENRMPDQEVYSLDGTTGAASIDVWFEASYSSVTDDRDGLNADTEFGMYAIGVDMMARENLLVGALVQFDSTETVTGQFRSQVEGDGWLAGPYMAARLSERLVFDARVAWGQSDNQVNPIGTYWDDFETDRWLAEANLVGDMVNGRWRLSPELGIAYFAEEQAQYTDSLGFVIPSQEITLGRITAGPELAYRFETDEGGVFEPFIRLTAVYDYDQTDVINSSGFLVGQSSFRADARIGLAAEFANGGRLSAEAGLIGLGQGDFEANTGMLRIRLPLSLN